MKRGLLGRQRISFPSCSLRMQIGVSEEYCIAAAAGLETPPHTLIVSRG